MPLAIPFWAILLLTLATFGFFPIILFFMQAKFIGKLERGRGPVLLGLAGLAFSLASWFLLSHSSVASSLLELAAGVLFLTAVFQMRGTMLRHYNETEPFGLKLSGVFTFFFGILYLQYHFSRIAKWKENQSPLPYTIPSATS